MTTNRATADHPTGLWIGAGLALSRPVPVNRPYPHICGVSLTGTMTGRSVRLGGRDCAACHEQLEGRPGPASTIGDS